jgi:LysR family glycine cleavage system transcriptional activator
MGVASIRRLPSLKALRTFEVAARHRNFREAAEELNLTPAAVSYHIKMLEDALGVELFRREDRSMVLTDAGQMIASGITEGFERISMTLERLHDMNSPASGDAMLEPLTVSVAPAFAMKWLIPRMKGFSRSKPTSNLQIDASRELIDLQDGAADIAIRFGLGDYPGLQVERLFNEVVTPICSPTVMEGNRKAIDVEALLRDIPLIHDDSYFFVDPRPTWEAWLGAAGIAAIDPSAGPRFSLSEQAIQAAIEGCGIALGRVSLTIDDVESGRLIYPFDVLLPLDIGYFLVGLPEVFQFPKVIAFRHWLHEETVRHEVSVHRQFGSGLAGG